jgi:hypothetical protein
VREEIGAFESFVLKEEGNCDQVLGGTKSYEPFVVSTRVKCGQKLAEAVACGHSRKLS